MSTGGSAPLGLLRAPGLCAQEVTRVADLLQCDFVGPAYEAILLNEISCDVHACPGSGKTTLLIAKLAMMARHWSSRDRGILVLSHTNVARLEVQRRLTADASAARLLTYPHFIGTIQAFVDRFLALPYLRSIGIAGVPVREPRVDDATFARVAWSQFKAGGFKEYPQARAWLSKKREQGRGVVEALFYQGPGVASAGGKLPGPHTATGLQLRKLKDTVSKLGLFRFADMFTFAGLCIDKFPSLADAVRRRFPWVFVDEMQDTARYQQNLLDRLFASGCIVQRFGDMNQGIFNGGGDEEASFSWVKSLELPKSHRFGVRLAEVASRLTIVHKQKIEGNTSRKDGKHTLFRFTSESIGNVLPAFGRLILEEWPAGVGEDFVAKAVGFRRGETTSSKFPARVMDYWAPFGDAITGDGGPAESLVRIVAWAQNSIAETREFAPASRVLMEGLARVVELQTGQHCTRRVLVERMREDRVRERAFRELVARLCAAGDGLDAARWGDLVVGVREVALDGCAQLATKAREFLRWEPQPLGPSPGTEKSTSAVYRHLEGDRAVSIELATIHGVKGETHDATLLLETFDREHDVPCVLRAIAGSSLEGLTKTQVQFVKRAFVALTRPKQLAAIAAQRDHVDPKLADQLAGIGWTIRDVPEKGGEA